MAISYTSIALQYSAGNCFTSYYVRCERCSWRNNHCWSRDKTPSRILSNCEVILQARVRNVQAKLINIKENGYQLIAGVFSYLNYIWRALLFTYRKQDAVKNNFMSTLKGNIMKTYRCHYAMRFTRHTRAFYKNGLALVKNKKKTMKLMAKSAIVKMYAHITPFCNHHLVESSTS